jgi:hypothetical protein
MSPLQGSLVNYYGEPGNIATHWHVPGAKPSHDIVMGMFSDCVWDHDFRDAHYALNLTVNDRSKIYDTEIEGEKPFNSRYHGPMDNAKYGNLWTRLLFLQGNRRSSDVRFARDHNVIHANVTGTFMPETDVKDTGSWYVAPFIRGGSFWPGFGSSPYSTGNVALATDLQLVTWDPNPGSDQLGGLIPIPSNMGCFASSIFDTISDGFEYQGMWSNPLAVRPGLTRRFSVLKSHFSSDRIYLFYRYDIEETKGEDFGSGSWLCKYEVELVKQDLDPIPFVPYNWYKPENYQIRQRYSYKFLGGMWTYYGTPQTYVSEDWIQGVWAKTPTYLRTNASNAGNIPIPSVTSHVRSELGKLRAFMARDMKDIRPSAFYSTADAIESHLETLDNNYIESIKELPEIASLIPDVGQFIRAISLVRSRPIYAGRLLGDSITDIVLKLNFAWRPNAQLISELNEHSDTILRSFDRFVEPDEVILQGKFYSPLPYHPHWGRRTLTTRTILCLQFTDSSFAHHILGLNSIGVLPTSSRVWEAVPSSFMVDWLTGMRRRLKDIDTSFMFSLMQLRWIEHSYTIECELDFTPLTEVDARRSDVSLVWFQRDLSTLWPPIRDSRYDFRSGRTPNLGILSSLVFQKVN